MAVTEEGTQLETPVGHNRAVRWWVAAVIGVLALGSGLLIGILIDDGGDQGLEGELAAVTAERDQLEAQIGAQQARYEQADSTQQAVIEIIADPTAFGTEEEVLDLLDQYAAPGTVYGDEAFGDVGWRIGWRNTLFGSVDADIQTWTRWLSDDGSTGGSLWSWNGTARNGEPFNLSGIVLEQYDDDGLYEALRVYYPMADEEVLSAFREGN